MIIRSHRNIKAGKRKYMGNTERNKKLDSGAGTNEKAYMECPKCKEKIPIPDYYCPYCGTIFINKPNIMDVLPVDNGQDKKVRILKGAVIALGILLCLALGVVLYSAKNKTSGKDNSTEIEGNQKEVVVADTALRKLDESMAKYINAVMTDQTFIDRGSAAVEDFDIVFTDAEKIRAAVLASDPDGEIDNYFTFANGKIVLDEGASTGPNGDDYHGWSVSNQDVEENCRSMFGTEASWDDLQSDAKCYYYDAVKYVDTFGTRALIIDSEAESEIDLESHEYRIRESHDGYIGEVEVYFGYWGKLSQNPDLSNYLLTYDLKPDDRSKYGLAISSIRITNICQNESDIIEESKAEESKAEENITEQVIVEVQKMPFYGVWCYASKYKNEAQNVAYQLQEIGFNAQVYISSEWSNLNQEIWYCVSADACQTKAEAEAVLRAARNAGYSDAYVKYSGDYE